LGNVYLWLKALHVLGVIAFMAGMLYLPRLFVYHAGVASRSAASELFKTMERRLEIAIMRPAFVVVIASGLVLAWQGGFFTSAWLIGKLILVAAMSCAYFYLIALRYRFAADENQHSVRFFRILNEIPTLLLIGIVILVVVKPF
jgi:protoporphyrinogen IX oxidase